MGSIRNKLWLSMMAVVAIMLVLLWLLQIVFLESFYTNMRLNDIKQKMLAIAAVAAIDEQQKAIDELERLALTQNLTVEWIDAEGRSLYRSSADSVGQMPMMRMHWSQLYQRLLAGEQVGLTLSHNRFGTEYRLMGVPVLSAKGAVKGAIVTTVPMAAVAETATILKRQLLYITAILLLVTGAISLWLARSLAQPILHIRQVAVTMASGDFSARAEYDGSDEIGMLAQAINYLGEQLARIEQLRRDLVANVSHDLRTPLSVIRGYAETIRDITGDQPEQRQEQLAVIIDETERLAHLVNDTLQLTLLQSGNVDLKLEALSVRELLEDVSKGFSFIAAQAGIKLVLEGDLDVMVAADAAKLAQVMHNLLQNSMQHTGAGGQIKVQVAATRQRVRIAVADTGSGIAATDLPYVWDKYYKGKPANPAEQRGTGLGLAIVKGILDAHAANYDVQSQLGRGTTIWFELKRVG